MKLKRIGIKYANKEPQVLNMKFKNSGVNCEI